MVEVSNMPAAVTRPAQPRALLRLRGRLLLAYVRGGASQGDVLEMYRLVERLLDVASATDDGGGSEDG